MEKHNDHDLFGPATDLELSLMDQINSLRAALAQAQAERDAANRAAYAAEALADERRDAATRRAEQAEAVVAAANALRDAAMARASHSMCCAACIDGIECKIVTLLWSAETSAEFALFSALDGPEGGERNGEDHA